MHGNIVTCKKIIYYSKHNFLNFSSVISWHMPASLPHFWRRWMPITVYFNQFSWMTAAYRLLWCQIGSVNFKWFKHCHEHEFKIFLLNTSTRKFNVEHLILNFSYQEAKLFIAVSIILTNSFSLLINICTFALNAILGCRVGIKAIK